MADMPHSSHAEGMSAIQFKEPRSKLAHATQKGGFAHRIQHAHFFDTRDLQQARCADAGDTAADNHTIAEYGWCRICRKR
jgi:hypothetical protein